MSAHLPQHKAGSHDTTATAACDPFSPAENINAAFLLHTITWA